MKERKPVSMGERWRREANRGVDDQRLDRALATVPSIRKSMLRIQPGSIRAEMEGAMGSIHEVSIHIALMPRSWQQVARPLRRSRSTVEALQQGRVPRSFDRLLARLCGEPLFPEPRRITAACTCDAQLSPCHHILALHELFARRLEERPWELVSVRGVDLAQLLERATGGTFGEDLPPLAFGATEEPLLYPEAEEGGLDYALSRGQVAQLLGLVPARVEKAVLSAMAEYRAAPVDGSPAEEL